MSSLPEQIQSADRGLRAHRELASLLKKTSGGKWRAEVDKVYSGSAVVAYISDEDGRFVAAAHNLLPDLLKDMARLRRIEAAAREYMGFVTDAVSQGPSHPPGTVMIFAADPKVREALVNRLKALSRALGE